MDIDAEIQKREQAKRAGTHVADGVMWCPTCGGQHVTSGHTTCEDCNPPRVLTGKELLAKADAERKLDPALSDEHKARKAKLSTGKGSKKATKQA